MPSLDALEKLLNGPRDGPLLRHSIGLIHLQEHRPARAAEFFRQAVEANAKFSASWKMLGKALVEAGDPAQALEAFRQGIAVAEAQGDLQASKEMAVFLRRLEKTPSATPAASTSPNEGSDG